MQSVVLSIKLDPPVTEATALPQHSPLQQHEEGLPPPPPNHPVCCSIPDPDLQLLDRGRAPVGAQLSQDVVKPQDSLRTEQRVCSHQEGGSVDSVPVFLLPLWTSSSEQPGNTTSLTFTKFSYSLAEDNEHDSPRTNQEEMHPENVFLSCPSLAVSLPTAPSEMIPFRSFY